MQLKVVRAAKAALETLGCLGQGDTALGILPARWEVPGIYALRIVGRFGPSTYVTVDHEFCELLPVDQSYLGIDVANNHRTAKIPRTS